MRRCHPPGYLSTGAPQGTTRGYLQGWLLPGPNDLEQGGAETLGLRGLAGSKEIAGQHSGGCSLSACVVRRRA